MKIGQKSWTKEKGWVDVLPQTFEKPPQIVFAFGERDLIEDNTRFKEIREMFPDSHILSCSTAGEILGTEVRDDSIMLNAIYFRKTTLSFAEFDITSVEDSYDVGKKLADALPKEKLMHTMIFSDGLHVNGTALVRGLNENLPPTVSTTGGFACDGYLKKTVVGLDHVAQEGKIVIVGFSGDALKIGYGSMGGWNTFGIERVITKSKDNILYELDNKPALELYKTYLGDKAKGLPNTGLLFPLRLNTGNGDKNETVRSISGINESDQSMTFFGDMPKGATATLMKTNPENLIDGASGAASMSIESSPSDHPDLAILISCIGRKLVLKNRTEEEIEAVRSVIGPEVIIAGFYSYGEICPTASTEKQCRFHNQTMNITVFREL